MKFLVDTNVILPVEPTTAKDVEKKTPEINEFLSIANRTGQSVFRHPASSVDLRRDRDEDRQAHRLVAFQKYPEITSPPKVPESWHELLGRPEKGSNDWVDHQLLAAVLGEAVDVLITEDRKLLKKSERLGLRERVATVDEALVTVRGLFDQVPPSPPAVQVLKSYNLNEHDPIFKSFREDYPDFDSWLIKCKQDHRDCWSIPGVQGRYAGIAVVKEEEVHTYGKEKVLKLCTFKISSDHSGRKLGELLLKAVFEFAVTNNYNRVYLTVFPKHTALIDMLLDFGFEHADEQTALGEGVFEKPMASGIVGDASSEPFEDHRRLGPFCVNLVAKPGFVVPIQPKYHDMLFPELAPTGELFPGHGAFGNAIRKAYLCRASTRQLQRGSPIWFYESQRAKSIRVLGVVESTQRSEDPDEVARFVGKRTVYKFSEIQSMCTSPVLAILFRQAIMLKRKVSLNDLLNNELLNGVPQSITSLSLEATLWLQHKMDQ